MVHCSITNIVISEKLKALLSALEKGTKYYSRDETSGSSNNSSAQGAESVHGEANNYVAAYLNECMHRQAKNDLHSIKTNHRGIKPTI